MVPVSAKTGAGIKDLLEAVLLVTEIKELKANPEKQAVGTVIEAKLDKGRGPVATVLIKNGTLSIGDSVIAGTVVGKIRAMFDDKGRRVKSAGPSIPVEVLGFDDVPVAGDIMHAGTEKMIKSVADERKSNEKLSNMKAASNVTLGDLFSKINEGQLKTLNLIIKTDVQGSLEALKVSLAKISNEEVKDYRERRHACTREQRNNHRFQRPTGRQRQSNGRGGGRGYKTLSHNLRCGGRYNQSHEGYASA